MEAAKATPKPERFFRPSKICELLCISKSYCYFLIASGQLEGVNFGSGKAAKRGLRVSESSLERYISRLRNGA